MEKNVEYLKNHYGNHTHTANAIGLTPRRYREIRNNNDYPEWIRVSIENLVTLLKLQKSKKQ